MRKLIIVLVITILAFAVYSIGDVQSNQRATNESSSSNSKVTNTIGLVDKTSDTSINKTLDNDTNKYSSQTLYVDTPDNALIREYFPFNKDVHMKYEGSGNEYAPFETYVDYVKDDLIQIRHVNGGTTSVNVYQIKDGSLIRVFSRGEVYYQYDATAFSNEKETILKTPIKVGTKWIQKDGSTSSITSIDKEIETAIGKLITIEVTNANPNSIMKKYYAKDIGLVKTQFKSLEAGMIVESVIEKIEVDVPQKQNIRVYYPDFDKDTVEYEDHKIEVFTNDNTQAKFETLLKNTPKENKKFKIISANTRILSILIDLKKELLVVNFSRELKGDANTKDINQEIYLKSLVETFKNYYNVQDVKITVQGIEF